MSNRVIIGDCREVLPTLEAGSVQTCVTSPPYWGLRDYGVAGQLGLESTPQEYVEKMVAVFREVRRVLKDDGTVFLNLGDSYFGSWGNYGGQNRGKGTQRDIGNGSQVPNPAYDGLEKFRPPTANSSTMFAQQYKMREDLTSEEKNHVAMEMFGVRIDRHDEAGQRAMSEVLSSAVHCGAVQDRPALAGEGIERELQAQSEKRAGTHDGAAQGLEVGSNREAGREVCVLRGDVTGVFDGGSCERGRGRAPEGVDRKEPRQFDQDLSGDKASRISEKEIQNSLLQLQLFNRVLGILSTHTFTDNEIPGSVKAHFRKVGGLKPKDLVGIPWRVAFALQADGWYLRQDIIWAKPNPMPESVRDRCTKSHEYMFLLAKSERYYFDADAIAEPSTTNDGRKPYARGQVDERGNGHDRGGGELRTVKTNRDQNARWNVENRNKRSVWTVTTQPFKEAHFATFPPKLIEPCILAGCPQGGTVLDPFGGAGTTGLVAERLGRKWLLIELNGEYGNLCADRTQQTGMVFA